MPTSRRLLLSRLLLITCLLAWGIPTATCHAEDWPRWGGVRADNSWAAPPLPEKWPADGLPVVWKSPLGGGYGGIAVSDGRLFVMDRQARLQERERLLCCSAATGELLWIDETPVAYGNLDYGNGPRCTPTVHDGRVYTLGALGHLRCVDIATGLVVWAHDCVKEYDAEIPMWGLAASPLIVDDLVIVQPGARPDGGFMAFHRLTGQPVWRASTDPAGYATPILAETASGPQLIAWTPEHILGLVPRTGEILWRIPYKITYGVSIATPIFHRGMVCVSGYWDGAKGIRLGTDPHAAELVWEEKRELRGLMSAPLVHDEHVYLLDRQRGITCFELNTGKKLWDDGNRATPRGRNPQATMVWTRDKNRVLILNADGDLILARLDPAGYHEDSRTNIIQPTERTPIWAHPAYSGRFVYARSDAELICRELVPESPASPAPGSRK